MTEHAPDRLWSGIQLSKVAAGTLAAVSAAVIGSFLGVAGTLIGAAVASVIGSVGTEIYQKSIDRSAKKLQTLAPTFIKAPAAVGTPEVAAATEDDAPSHSVAPDEVTTQRAEEQPKSKLRWRPILLGAAVVFIVAMGAIFAVEAVAGRSLASITGNGSTGGSTIGVPVRKSEAKPAPSATPSESASPSESETSSTTPSSEAPATGQPVQPTTDTPAPQNTQAPTTTDAPQQPTQTGGAEQQNQEQPAEGTE